MHGALRDRMTLTISPSSRRSDEDQRALCAAAGRARGPEGRLRPLPVWCSLPRAVHLVDLDAAGRDPMGLAGIMARMRFPGCHSALSRTPRNSLTLSAETPLDEDMTRLEACVHVTSGRFGILCVAAVSAVTLNAFLQVLHHSTRTSFLPRGRHAKRPAMVTRQAVRAACLPKARPRGILSREHLIESTKCHAHGAF